MKEMYIFAVFICILGSCAKAQFEESGSSDYEIFLSSYGSYGSGSTADIPLLPQYALPEPPCLLPFRFFESRFEEEHQRHLVLNERQTLNIQDLATEKVQRAAFLAVDKYTASHSNSNLTLIQLIGGCKQNIAGELLYLMFKATEVLHCQNCTVTSPMERECRARVHISTSASWNPFYVNCEPPEYFSLPWRKLSWSNANIIV